MPRARFSPEETAVLKRQARPQARLLTKLDKHIAEAEQRVNAAQLSFDEQTEALNWAIANATATAEAYQTIRRQLPDAVEQFEYYQQKLERAQAGLKVFDAALRQARDQLATFQNQKEDLA